MSPYTQLLSMEWNLGVSISSSSCRALKAPFVSLSFRVLGEGGAEECRSVELSLPEFQMLKAHFEEISAQMDNNSL